MKHWTNKPLFVLGLGDGFRKWVEYIGLIPYQRIVGVVACARRADRFLAREEEQSFTCRLQSALQ